MFSVYAFAQSDCSNSQNVSLQVDGTTTVNSSGVSGTAPTSTCNSIFYTASDVSAGDWYTFTPSQDLVVTITAAVPGSVTNDYIASASAYEGSCGNLICVGGDLITVDGQDNLVPVEIQFIASANTAYYIAFDDYYANIPAPDGPLGTTAAFSFDVSTSTNIPTAPNAATNPTPTDGATNVDVVETTDDNGGPIEQVAIQWNEPTTGPTPTGYEVYLGTDQNSLNFLGTAQSDAAGSPINITGMQYDTTY
ncbi:MAG: hypothetical protein RI535_02230, partial [Psychroflexus sp.]|nr:hypothetical protein [Psychroflexus sp.]